MMDKTHATFAPKRERFIRRLVFQLAAVFPIVLLFAAPKSAVPQDTSSTTWAVTIVLPPQLVAGRPATLAVLGVDGRLAEGIVIDLGTHSGTDVRVKTDKTGRAAFLAPTDTAVLIAKASGAAAAALIDPVPAPNSAPSAISLEPVVSRLDAFQICGGPFHGEAEADHVRLNDDPALVLAASPACLVILAGPRAAPGPANISIETGRDKQYTAATTLVALHFDPPVPPLLPEKRSSLVLHVQGSDHPLRILAENKTPGVLHFLRGDTQELLTSGGAQNVATIEIQTLSTGDFSFRARILQNPDPQTARRYLEASQPLAPKELQRQIQNLAKQLARNARDTRKTSAELKKILSYTIAGDFRTLLESAYATLE
jgi:hypothetical protein